MSESSTGAPETNTGYLVSDLVGLALEQLGVGVGGQNADPQGMNSGVMHLNMMLAQWQRRRWLVPNLVDTFCMSTGASSYTVGDGQQFDIAGRPDRIQAAYARLATSAGFSPSTEGDFNAGDFTEDFQLGSDGLDANQYAGPLDYPLGIIESYEDYSAIGLKGLRTWPSRVFYQPSFPVGKLYFWPIPQSGNWELHVVTKEVLPNNLIASSAINLPPEYWDAIMWCLAERLAPSYGQSGSPIITAMARTAMQTIKLANRAPLALEMPSAVRARRGAGANPYWIYSGGFS